MKESHVFADIYLLVNGRLKEFERHGVEEEILDGGRGFLAAIEALEGKPRLGKQIVRTALKMARLKSKLERDKNLTEAQRVSGKAGCYKNLLLFAQYLVSGLATIHRDSAVVLPPGTVAFIVYLLIPFEFKSAYKREEGEK